jgi:hypothetical protein
MIDRASLDPIYNKLFSYLIFYMKTCIFLPVIFVTYKVYTEILLSNFSEFFYLKHFEIISFKVAEVF